MKKALLLVDIQNDYFPEGKNPLFNSKQAAEKTKQALTVFRENNLPIFHVKHTSLQENATFFLPDTDGIQIYESVLPKDNECIIVKHTHDSFYQTNLQELLTLSGIDELYICGMMSHMCIDTSVRSAKRLGYSVTLLSDACTTKDLIWEGNMIPAQTVHLSFKAALNGTFAKVINLAELEI